MRARIDVRAGFLFGCSLSLLVACTKDVAPTTTFGDPLPPRVESEEWVLSFSDEFDAKAVETSKWFVTSGDLRHGITINSASPSLAIVRDGSMFLSAEPSPENKALPYATGYVDTHGLFAQTYGKIEFRARSPYAPGVWYALWGRSWTNLVPEIDIEFLSENTTQAWFVNHWGVPPLPPDERRGFTTVDGMDITQFHTYTITWKPDFVEWQIDGKSYRRVTELAKVPHGPMFWVMNAWVGGWGGTPSPATQFPAEMDVDYLCIYRLREWSTEPVIRIANPKTKVTGKDTIDAQIADFDMGARVEVWEGEALLQRLSSPPFKLRANELKRGPHTLTFVGTDGARRATTSVDAHGLLRTVPARFVPARDAELDVERAVVGANSRGTVEAGRGGRQRALPHGDAVGRDAELAAVEDGAPPRGAQRPAAERGGKTERSSRCRSRGTTRARRPPWRRRPPRAQRHRSIAIQASRRISLRPRRPGSSGRIMHFSPCRGTRPSCAMTLLSRGLTKRRAIDAREATAP